jgi:hypothetical protein
MTAVFIALSSFLDGARIESHQGRIFGDSGTTCSWCFLSFPNGLLLLVHAPLMEFGLLCPGADCAQSFFEKSRSLFTISASESLRVNLDHTGRTHGNFNRSFHDVFSFRLHSLDDEFDGAVLLLRPGDEVAFPTGFLHGSVDGVKLEQFAVVLSGFLLHTALPKIGRKAVRAVRCLFKAMSDGPFSLMTNSPLSLLS